MKGVLLCGGTGTRLQPLTNGINKHLLPVGPEPMFFHPLRSMREAGVTEAAIVCGSVADGVLFCRMSKAMHLPHLSFGYQHSPLGTADALCVARWFCGDEPFLFMLGDTILDGSIATLAAERDGAAIMVQRVPDPERCAVIDFDSFDGCLTDIVEKPEHPPSDLGVLGAYWLTPRVWEYLPALQPSKRGEYELTDLLRMYLRDGALSWTHFEGQYADAGTLEGYRRACEIAWAMHDREATHV